MENYKYAISIAVKNLKYFRECLDSIKAQTYKEWHLYVYFNGSQPDLLEPFIQEFDAKPNQYTYMICKKALGTSTPRNHIWSVAVEPYLIQFDGDDLMPVDYLELVNSFNNEKPEIDYSYADLYVYTDKPHGLHVKPDWGGTYQEKIAIINHQFMPFPGCCMSKKFYKAERLEERWPIAGDHDIAIKASLLYNVAHRNQYFYYRTHAEQISEAHLTEQKDFDEEVKAYWREQIKKGKVKL